jgi:L-fuculose-phosphate aldolase
MDSTVPEQICYVGQMMFERRLTDFSGGNISVRDGDTIWISPRYAGSKQHWNLDPSDIVHGPIDTEEITEHPRFSREGYAHLSVYRTFPDAQACIHAHPFYVLPFCAAGKPIIPVLESSEKFESIDVIPFAPAHSRDLAANIVEGLRPREHLIAKKAAGVILPRHGTFMAGGDLFDVLDVVERINWNAWCILAQNMLPSES